MMEQMPFGVTTKMLTMALATAMTPFMAENKTTPSTEEGGGEDSIDGGNN